MLHTNQNDIYLGDWKNVKMTGIINDSPAGFINSVMNFTTRKTWEGMYEDGILVEAVDIGMTFILLFYFRNL